MNQKRKSSCRTNKNMTEPQDTPLRSFVALSEQSELMELRDVCFGSLAQRGGQSELMKLPEEVIVKILEFTCELNKSNFENMATTCKSIRRISRGHQFADYFKCQNCNRMEIAIEKDHLTCCKWHLNKTVTSKQKINLLCAHACEYGSLKIIKYLVSRGANIRTERERALRFASANGHLEVVKYLALLGANINAYDDNSLRLASEKGHLEVVKYLVSLGADIHSCYDFALGLASKNGYIEVVKYLVSLGADIDADNDYAVRWASANGHLEVVKYLASLGANTHARNDWAVQCASENGHFLWSNIWFHWGQIYM